MSSDPFLSAAEAARRLGVSAKALRLYERRGLIAPDRTRAGWRVYGPADIRRASDVITLRSLGLSLAQIRSAVEGGGRMLEQVLADHQGALEGRMGALAAAAARLRDLMQDISARSPQDIPTPAAGLTTLSDVRIAFDLPWPWGGESFEVGVIRALNYIVGPLGSGKTRLAQRLAEMLPNAAFVGPERLAGADAPLAGMPETTAGLKLRVDAAMERLIADGAEPSDALTTLVIRLERDPEQILVIDMVEQGLDRRTQEALIVYLRRREAGCRPLFLMTRSSAILDLTAVGSQESIIFCPANHSPPIRVAAHPGARGYEAVATCLAPPEVRARTEGMVARRPGMDHLAGMS